MTEQELYLSIFKPFNEWLKEKGLQDMFSMQTKMNQVFQALYVQFMRGEERRQQENMIKMSLNEKELTELLDKKRAKNEKKDIEKK